MEVTCALLLAIVSTVSATPYGYGAKGGAVAKAEAGAVAGGYGGAGFPSSAPSRPGSYSGSFSKSSASSYASSSASSSAYSYSGSAPSGQAVLGLPGQQKQGCAGGCQNNGDKNLHYGSAPYSGASAGAYAGAAAGSFGQDKIEKPCSGKDCNAEKSPICEGPDCKNEGNDCKSGQCGSSSPIESNDIGGDKPASKPAGYSVTECAEGNCGQAPTASSGYASASSHLTTPKLVPSNRPSSYNVPIQSVYESSSPNGKHSTCTYGNCGNEDSPSDDGSKIYFGQNSKQRKPECTTPDCEVSKPSTYLEAPVLNNKPTCSGGSCSNSQPSTPNDIGPINAPSNLPFLPLNGENKLPGTAPPQGNYGVKGTQGSSPPHYSPTIPNRPSYGSAPVTQLTGPYGLPASPNPTPTGSYSPAVVHGSPCPGGVCNWNKPSGAPIGVPVCTTPGCSSHAPSPGNVPNIPYQPPGGKDVPYTGGFGGPPGILNPNDYSLPSNSNYKPGSPTSCTSGNCNQPSQPGPIVQPSENKPTGFPSPARPASYPTGSPSGSYQPTGPSSTPCFLGNCNQGSSPTYPTAQPSGPPATNIPSIPSGPAYYPTVQPSAPLGGYKPTAPVTYPTGQPSAPSGSYKPSAPAAYPTGQPSAPSGSYKPSAPAAYPTGQPSAPLGSYQPSGPANYPTGQHTGPTGSYHPGLGTTGPETYPSAQPAFPSGGYKPNKIPCFLGNCNQSPTGPANHPTGSYSPTTQEIPCTSGNCNNQGSDVFSGNYKPSSPNQIPCFLGNCDQGSSGPPAPGYNPTSDVQKPTGTGNFNQSPTGPSGGSVPSYVRPTAPSGQYKPTSPGLCASGNCNAGASNNQPTGISAPCTSGNCESTKPGYNPSTIPSGVIPISKPACTSGNCNTGSNSAASATAHADAIYTGGFGGPPGLLKPYDDGKLPGVGPSGKQLAQPNASDKPSSSYGASGALVNNPSSSYGANSGSQDNNPSSSYGANSGSHANNPSSSYGANSGAHANPSSSYGANSGAQTNHNPGSYGAQSGALAGAAAGAGSGSYGAKGGDVDGKPSGCNSGCGGDGAHGAAGSASATASASAVASAKSYAHSSAYASSSASAHSGAHHIKSGYGR